MARSWLPPTANGVHPHWRETGTERAPELLPRAKKTKGLVATSLLTLVIYRGGIKETMHEP